MSDREVRRCPATTRHTTPWSGITFGVQCKYTPDHEGDHAGYAGFSTGGDVFWPREDPAEPAPALSAVSRYRG